MCGLTLIYGFFNNMYAAHTLAKSKHMHRRRQWPPTPVLSPGKSHRRRSLVGCSPWGRSESDTTERLHFTHLTHFILYHWRRKWPPTPVLLPGESHGQRSLAGHGPHGGRESDTTEVTEQACTHRHNTHFVCAFHIYP